MASGLTGAQLAGVDKFVARLSKFGPLVSKAAIPALNKAVKIAGAQLKQINVQARKKHDYLTATLTQFKVDLAQGVADKLLIRNPK